MYRSYTIRLILYDAYLFIYRSYKKVRIICISDKTSKRYNNNNKINKVDKTNKIDKTNALFPSNTGDFSQFWALWPELKMIRQSSS